MTKVLILIFCLLTQTNMYPKGNNRQMFKTPWLVLIQICYDDICGREKLQSSKIQTTYCPYPQNRWFNPNGSFEASYEDTEYPDTYFKPIQNTESEENPYENVQNDLDCLTFDQMSKN